MKWIALSLLMLCVGCAARGHLPSPIDSVPNVLTKDTKVVVLADSTGAIPRGTVVETQAEDQPLIEVALKEDTIVVVAGQKGSSTSQEHQSDFASKHSSCNASRFAHQTRSIHRHRSQQGNRGHNV